MAEHFRCAFLKFCRPRLNLMMTVAEVLKAREEKANNGPWFAASGGTEKPFLTRTGRRLQYMWQPSTGKHAYIDCDSDIFLTDDEAAQALGL